MLVNVYVQETYYSMNTYYVNVVFYSVLYNSINSKQLCMKSYTQVHSVFNVSVEQSHYKQRT